MNNELTEYVVTIKVKAHGPLGAANLFWQTGTPTLTVLDKDAVPTDFKWTSQGYAATEAK